MEITCPNCHNNIYSGNFCTECGFRLKIYECSVCTVYNKCGNYCSNCESHCTSWYCQKCESAAKLYCCQACGKTKTVKRMDILTVLIAFKKKASNKTPLKDMI